MATIAIHGFGYNSGCRKESPSYGLRSLWAVDSGLFEEKFAGWWATRAFQTLERRENKKRARRPINLSVRRTLSHHHQSTKGDLQIICWDTAIFAPRNQAKTQKAHTSPGALGQNNCLRKSATRHPRTFVTNDSYIVQPILYSFLSIYLDRAEQEVAI